MHLSLPALSRRRVRWPALVAAACACGPIDESKTGAIGNGSFAYACVSNNDAFCPNAGTVIDSGPDSPFPAAIALDAPFQLSYFPTDSSAYRSPTVLAVSPDFISQQGDTFTALQPGSPWFYVSTGQRGILDITSIEAQAIASIQVKNTAGASLSAFSTTQGEVDTFTATPLGSEHVELAGDVTYTWSVADPTVVSLQGVSGAASVQAAFPSPGTTTVTVTAQNVMAVFTVQVGAR